MVEYYSIEIIILRGLNKMCNKVNEKYTSIDVEKLNIVEKDGTIKMSLFNSQNMPPLIFDGEDILPGHRQGTNKSGIMF